MANLTGKRKPTDELVNFYIGAINDKQDLNPLTLLVCFLCIITLKEHDVVQQAVEMTATELTQLEIVNTEVEAQVVESVVPFSEGVIVFDANNNAFAIMVRIRQ